MTTQDTKRVQDAMNLFQQTYNKGYKTLLEELKKSKNVDMKAFQAKEEGLKMLDNPAALKKFLDQGKAISEVLGFSNESVDTLYQTAHHILAEKRYQDAKDAFFFLVTIAPQVTECWLGLGFAYGQCKETEGAIHSYLRAIALSPHKADGYIAFMRLFSAQGDIPRAQRVCDIGMEFVKEHEKQPWAQELAKALKETRETLKSQK
jgi:tetratricopeptide (TPR) repeat protein